MAPKPKRIFGLISGSIFISIMLYMYYQESYPLLIPQESYDSYHTINNDEFPGNTRNYSSNNVPDSYKDNPSQDARSNLFLVSEKRFRPLPVPITSDKEECLPFFKDVSVKAVPEHDCHQPHVVMNHGGRLGNKLCQYASIYLLRHLYGVRVSIKEAMDVSLRRIMKNVLLPVQDSICFTNRTERIKYDAMYMKLYKATFQAKTNATDNNPIVEPLLNVSYYIFNNPGPRSLLMAHRDLVRSILRFKDEVVKQAINNIDKALKPFNATYHDRNFPIITVHVRRTDYTGYMRRKFKLTQLDDLYFRRAFKFYKRRLKQPVFLVLSDDPVWCKQKLQAKDVMVIASGSPPVDMAVMSLGDHHVTSYGTYSFTGALLGRGHITHPIGHNRKYNLVDCVYSPFFHHISKDTTYEVDNSNVVL